MYRISKGFTLVELAMVLFILTLIIGSILTPLSSSIEQQDRKTTDDMLVDIRESLIGYALVNGHLPCPDCPSTTITADCAAAGLTINDGIEDGVDAGNGISPRAGNTYDSCATVEGNLPWVTLDVPENDAWGNRFIYRVTDEFADDDDGTAACTNPAAGVSFCLDSPNNADINITDAAGAAVASNVPAVIVSLGNNSSEPVATLSAAEQANQDTNTTFVANDYIQATGSEFDDLLIWITPPTLIYQMVRAEKLP